jgi:quercetin dioxygenase-like cupin family protein
MRLWTSSIRRSVRKRGEMIKHFKAASMQWVDGPGYSKRRLSTGDLFPQEVDLLQEVRFRKGSTIPPHYHKEQTEIFFVLAKGSITIDDRRIDAEAGDVIVCEPGEVHGMPLVEEDFGFLVIKINYREDDTVWL